MGAAVEDPDVVRLINRHARALPEVEAIRQFGPVLNGVVSQCRRRWRGMVLGADIAREQKQEGKNPNRDKVSLRSAKWQGGHAVISIDCIGTVSLLIEGRREREH